MSDYIELPVFGGYKTKVDPDIAEKFKGKKLYLKDKKRKKPYVSINKNKKNIVLHRFIINAKKGKVVDHKNGDTLDNRRCNLRICNQSINILNHHTKPKSISGYWGVFKHNKRFFRIGVSIKKCKKFCGLYKNKVIAAIFRDNIIIKEYGLRIGLNFKEEIKEINLREFLSQTKGRIFKIYFVRRSDGKLREMLCRTGVKLDTNGNGLKIDPEQYMLFNVYDMINKCHRFISLENVICLTFKKTTFLITRDPLSLAA